MCEKDSQHLFNNKSPGRGELLIMVFFYLFIGGLALLGDLFLNHTNYGFPQLKWLVMAVSTGVLISGVNVIIARFTPAGQKLESMLKDMLGNSSLSCLLLLVIIGAISEEIIFRGLGLGWLTSELGPWPALGITSIIFGFLHGFFRAPFVLWSITALAWGLVLGFMMLESGFILVPMIVHATINVLGVAWLHYHDLKEGLKDIRS